jgi:hypothetical protein
MEIKDHNEEKEFVKVETEKFAKDPLYRGRYWL